MRPVCAAALMSALFLADSAGAGALELRGQRTSPYDLALTGRLAGVPAGETRYASWEDLRSLPTTQLRLDGEFVKGPQVVTVVFLSDLWKALPVAGGADTLLATCGDGYAAVFTADFIAKYRPFLVLEIDGKGPSDWPPPGLKFNPGPYAVTVSSGLVPSAAAFPDIEHKKPWGVSAIEVASFAERFRGAYSGRWASPGPEGRAGREIWVNSCASCHPGPGGSFGGTKAGRPFEVIAAYASYDKAFFEKYVRDPKSLVPCAAMEPHPRYTDRQLDQLVTFVAAGKG